MSGVSETYIAVRGKTRDIGFLAGILREKKIPFRQALTYGREPIIKIPQTHAAALQAILDTHRAQHPIRVVSADEFMKAQNLFWVMVTFAVAILMVAWGRYFLRKFF